MSLFHTSKPKSAGKVMIPTSDGLQDVVLKTLSHIASMVGVTLGPGGRAVLLEHPEINKPHAVTKDGVTVIKHLGYKDSVQQLILEAARSAATRTASEAGDGTTTATLLANAITRQTAEAVRGHGRLSPQKIVREMQALFPKIEAELERYKLEVTGENSTEVLTKVAQLSANGDKELADITVKALDLVGEDGNTTIIELVGPSKYSVERINGYTIEQGYEESCRSFANGFINDKSGTNVVLENPVFILFDGVVNDQSQYLAPISKLAQYFQETQRHNRGVVFVAHGFSDAVLGELHHNWNEAASWIKIFPLATPRNIIMNWQSNFLYDLQAYTGSPVFNPLTQSLVDLDPKALCESNMATGFEAGRFRSSVMATEDMSMVELRVEELKEQLKKPESQYEANDLNVRIGKLTGGIAKIIISGPSQSETREKRDRAEDAWMAVRGAIRYGAVPGGGYSLVRLAASLMILAEQQTSEASKLATHILGEAFLAPVRLLYSNYGYNNSEVEKQLQQLLIRDGETFDILEQKWVQRHEILDSLPAVLEAIRNSVSIASLLGTLGGIVAFERNDESDKAEEKMIRSFERAIG